MLAKFHHKFFWRSPKGFCSDFCIFLRGEKSSYKFGLWRINYHRLNRFVDFVDLYVIVSFLKCWRSKVVRSGGLVGSGGRIRQRQIATLCDVSSWKWTHKGQPEWSQWKVLPFTSTGNFSFKVKLREVVSTKTDDFFQLLSSPISRRNNLDFLTVRTNILSWPSHIDDPTDGVRASRRNR